MDVVRTSETWVYSSETTRRYNPEDCHLSTIGFKPVTNPNFAVTTLFLDLPVYLSLRWSSHIYVVNGAALFVLKLTAIDLYILESSLLSYQFSIFPVERKVYISFCPIDNKLPKLKLNLSHYTQ
jgi:hypothetical protein